MFDFLRRTKIFKFVHRGSPGKRHAFYNKIVGYDIETHIIGKSIGSAEIRLCDILADQNIEITDRLESYTLTDAEIEEMDPVLFKEIDENGIHCELEIRLN